ncbi:MAG: hypothetical protein H0X03_09660 [Nitrosopumilus sp.]|nr:hypothetical protein [Nitrosopumilus sp.]
MSEFSQQSEKDNDNKEDKMSNISELFTKLIDKLISQDVSVTYTFDHLEIDVPTAHGPGGKELGGAKWVVDGKIIISTSSTHKGGSSTDSSKYVTA